MRRVLVAVFSAALLLGGLTQVPTLAGAPVVPATVTGGTGTLYTSDNCGSVQAPTGVWIYSLDLTLALRVNGRQRILRIASPWKYPPNWPDYTGGDRSVTCDYRTLPTMSFTGTATDGPSLATEPVHGWCEGHWGLVDTMSVGCRLSIHGRAPFDLKLALVDVYDAADTEHSAGEDLNSTFVVTGVQHVAPS